jgi:sigma-E factor negative regulatory protein RseB
VLYTPGITHRRRGRQLLISAALALGVPGCLLSLAACGGQPGTRAHAQSTALAQRQAQVHAGQDLARSQPQKTPPRPQSNRTAVQLLTEAAQQGVRQTYLGEEIIWRETAGGTILDAEIYHQSGGPTFTQTLASTESQPSWPADPDGQSPEGVLGVTTTLVQLLETNYVLSYQGSAAIDDRPAQVVEARRADGSLAAEYWLDTATKLPLKRLVYSDSRQLISVGSFNDVTIGAGTAAPAFAGGPQPKATVWSYPIAPAQLFAFSRQGWVVPPVLPGGLTLFTGGETFTPTGPVLDLAYSDGLYVVSVFEQRGKLAAKLAGWQKTKVAGEVVYAATADQQSLTWSSRDVVYTLIADAPSQTVNAAVGKLPHDEPPGFWKRISRGFVRLAHMVNPFG